MPEKELPRKKKPARDLDLDTLLADPEVAKALLQRIAETHPKALQRAPGRKKGYQYDLVGREGSKAQFFRIKGIELTISNHAIANRTLFKTASGKKAVVCAQSKDYSQNVYVGAIEFEPNKWKEAAWDEAGGARKNPLSPGDCLVGKWSES